ncbi:MULTISPECIES: SDR family oxidoreductase [Sphingobium]|uniref:SDR family NAD(P)-dependent oxidoreductase n=1 Tax=Sphingobium fuliginis ATCC 27551 TaxID=1208342 RepID=A0A5B8CG40_SPHSA|nr:MULTISPECIES: SDR family NAD(P)-dependent oxidoreductase [Sphingobium]OAP33602.1 short-chain dehydrogenase [Sphingobium sp. 20006FA]AJR25370.1 short-chain dehydrogenase [Sphingobium sp. YBL2]KXU33536.1 short-chain dehydrogenase [Sphingobium sp. AM]KYC33991.1 short-chain dehydrogenase [Sphingobium sp. 22B]QDC36937.1 SDR family NAD(P)-dependent oxidoreductase [Sphingobium fuliginis ATCC 27551]
MRKIDLPPFDRAAFADKYGPWAIIAGASEGTGACYAEQLAAMGIHLVLVSRRQEALDALGQRLATEHGIEYRAITADLTEQSAGSRLVEATADLDIGLYISNAGADGAGNSFFGEPVDRSLRLLTMNAANVLEAVHGFGNRFLKRGKGGVVVMSSGAGLGGQPWLVMYSATKAFELNFVESLWAELEGQNVDIVGIAAPIMDTPTLRRATEGLGMDYSMAYDPADVCALALASLGKEPLVIVPDGPDEEKIPQIQADRKTRLVALAEWGKAYTAAANG